MRQKQIDGLQFFNVKKKLRKFSTIYYHQYNLLQEDFGLYL